MRTFLVILGIVVVLVIVYFIWADYKSRKETETIIRQTSPVYATKPKKNTVLDWVTSLIPVITGTVDTILSKPKKPEEVEDISGIGPPTYEEWLAQQDIT